VARAEVATALRLAHAMIVGLSDANRMLFRNGLGEVKLQQTLAGDGHEGNVGARRPIKVVELLTNVAGLAHNHNAAKDKRLEVDTPSQPLEVASDAVLLGRVLMNMVINAFEATPAGESVRMWCERHVRGASSHVRFSVWNPSLIPPETKLRIFQRHFSTKSSWGRGVGTWSMKLIGENFLQGKVDFRSELEEGTTFYLELPEAPAV
jgi:signal transduction histidine kinase